jgi:hypothetical protein
MCRSRSRQSGVLANCAKLPSRRRWSNSKTGPIFFGGATNQRIAARVDGEALVWRLPSRRSNRFLETRIILDAIPIVRAMKNLPFLTHGFWRDRFRIRVILRISCSINHGSSQGISSTASLGPQ